MTPRIGIDLGGTKIEGIVLDESGQEHWRKRVDTPKGDYAGTIRAVSGLVSAAEQAASGNRATVGLGIPGSISPKTGLIKNANSTWLIGKPFDRDLAKALDRPVRLENDANCLAVSEASDGAGAGHDVVFAVIMGTGCGAGLAINGKALRGRNALTGEWGHNGLPWPDDEEQAHAPDCYCGLKGCIETWISGTGFAADHARVTGTALSGQQIIDQARTGDAECAASLARLTNRTAKCLATVVNMLDPDCIVIGGGLSNIPELLEPLPELVENWSFSDGIDTPILKSLHGDSSGVRGAAWLFSPAESASLLG
ncbi:MAG: fructokinase [Alphaproteobacteria bacterium]